MVLINQDREIPKELLEKMKQHDEEFRKELNLEYE